MKRITKRTADATKPAARDVLVWDTELSGFGLKVTPAGRRVYVVQYRPAGMGRRAPTKRLTLGEHGVITAEQARTMAKERLADVTKGSDPAGDRKRRKDALTVQEMGAEFLADVDAQRKPTTAAEYRRLWEKHVEPALGSLKVEAVTVGDVRRLHRSLKATPYLANRVLALLGSAFSFAESESLRAKHSNPAHDVAAFAESARERFLTPDEVRRLGDVLRIAERQGLPPAPKRKRKAVTEATRKHYTEPEITPANPFAIAALRFLLLTGCRESEALTLRWSSVDLERGFLRLTDSKTGKSERALSAPAAALLDALPRVADSPFVFPGRTSEVPLRDAGRLWDAVRHAAKLTDVRLHDLRHSFASVSALGGDSLLVIGKLLGHKNARTTAKYAHLGDDPVKAAADRTGSTLAALLAGAEKPVTPLRRAKRA